VKITPRRGETLVVTEQNPKHGTPLDTQAIVSAIRKGRSFAPTGPMTELDVAGAHPCAELATEHTATSADHARAREPRRV